jgi:hypothetical protein
MAPCLRHTVGGLPTSRTARFVCMAFAKVYPSYLCAETPSWSTNRNLAVILDVGGGCTLHVLCQ